MPLDHAQIFLDDCNGWIKSNIRQYVDQYFPCSNIRWTKHTIQDLKCPLCAQATASIHLKHHRIECTCLDQPLKPLALVQIIESDPMRALERMTGLSYVKPKIKPRRR